MGLRRGEVKEMKFGEVEEGGIEGIEGIELLEAWKEEERKKRREEKGIHSEEETEEEGLEKEEEQGWKNWDVEEDDSDDSGGWIDVDSDGPDIEISDSEEDGPPTKKAKTDSESKNITESVRNETNGSSADQQIPDKKIVSNLATTRILTPADLAKLRELQRSSAISKTLGNGHPKSAKASNNMRHADDPLTAEDIELPGNLARKTTKEDKIAAAKADREDNHQSTTAKRKEKKKDQGKSSTNKEKERQKNFLMMLGKAKRKGKRSLGEVRKVLRRHVDRQKKGGRRGNR